MGLFDFLFGGNNAKNPARMSSRPKQGKVIYFSDKFVEIPSLGFFGQFKKSKSSEWVICWSDSDEPNHRGGHRDSGHGHYVLYNVTQDKVALQGRLERPYSGSVADNGRFSVEDWHFGGVYLERSTSFLPLDRSSLRKSSKPTYITAAFPIAVELQFVKPPILQ